MSQRLQRDDVAARDETVYIGQRGAKTQRCRSEVWPARQRVKPEKAMAGALKSGDLAGQQCGITSLPPVRDQEHDGSASNGTANPALVELSQAFADSGAAAPVHDPIGHSAQRGVWAAAAELAGNSGEPGSEHEDFEWRATSVQRMREPQHEAAVPLHRSTDVTYQDERPRDLGASEPAPAERFPSGAE